MMKKQYLLYVIVSLVWGTLFFACNEEKDTTDDPVVLVPSVVFDAAAVKAFEFSEGSAVEIPIPEAIIKNGSGTITYSITVKDDTTEDDAEDPMFVIGGDKSNQIVLVPGKSLRYEDAPSHTLVITASSGSITSTIHITIHVVDVDKVVFDMPSPLRITYPENTWTNIPLPSATVEDDDSYDTFTYTISKRSDAADPLFAIGGEANDKIVLVSGKILDYESEITNHILVITATSSIDSSITGDFQVEITAEDVAEPPVIAAIPDTTAFEEATTTTDTVLIDIDAVDSDVGQVLTYTINPIHDLFVIDAMTGEVRFTVSPDYETISHRTNTFTIEVIDDEEGMATTNITIHVTPKDDEAPLITSHSDRETIFGTPGGGETDVVSFTVEDRDDPVSTWSYILGGTDAGKFTVNANTGVLAFVNASDVVTNVSYSITVIVIDGVRNESPVYNFTIKIPGVFFNRFVPTTFYISETVTTLNIPIPSVEIRHGAEDGSPIVYTITAGNTGTTFTIGGADSNEIVFADGKRLDHESGVTDYTLTITVSAGPAMGTIDIIINVLDVDIVSFDSEWKTIHRFNEDVASSSNINSSRRLLYVPPAETDDTVSNPLVTYSIVDGNDAALFTLGSDTGIYLAPGKILNYESISIHVLTITATLGGSSISTNITINVNNVDEPPIVTNMRVTHSDAFGTGFSFSSNSVGYDYSSDANWIRLVNNGGKSTYKLFVYEPESGSISCSFGNGSNTVTGGWGVTFSVTCSNKVVTLSASSTGIIGGDVSTTLVIKDQNSNTRTYRLSIRAW